METRLNIAEILKDKPQNTRLYSLTYGNCYFQEYTGDFGIECQSQNVVQLNFNEYGQYSIEGECLLFPSKEMRDWEKFAWKKGDVLSNSCGFQCIFKEWASDDYTRFNGCYSNSRDGYEDVSNAETAKFYKLDNNTAYGYVREIEKRLEGKLNLETLEVEANVNVGDVVSDDVLYGICTKVDNSNVYCDFGCDSSKSNAPITKLCLKKENIHVVMSINKEIWYKEIEEKHHISIDRNTLKVQTEFKDGDIIYCHKDAVHFPSIHILNTNYDTKRYYVQLVISCSGNYSYYDIPACNNDPNRLRLATEKEKQLLFAALAKENKAWDAEKKEVIDLKPKVKFKPFDRVLVREDEYSEWQANIFSNIDEDNRFVCISSTWDFCLPYNDKTAKLMGTTNTIEED